VRTSGLLKSILACLLTTAATFAWLSTTPTPFGSLNVQSSSGSMLGCPWTARDQVLEGRGGVLRVCGGDGNNGSSSGNFGRVLGIISA
jgi:hypothetical protein